MKPTMIALKILGSGLWLAALVHYVSEVLKEPERVRWAFFISIWGPDLIIFAGGVIAWQCAGLIETTRGFTTPIGLRVS